MKVVDIAKAVAENFEHEFVGIRPGEKLHEQMVGFEDAPFTYEYSDYFKIFPSIKAWDEQPHNINNGKKVPDDFTYTSSNNEDWMSIEELKIWINKNEEKLKRGLIK